MIASAIDLAPRPYGRAALRRAGFRADPGEAQPFIYWIEMDIARRGGWNEAIVRLGQWAADPGVLEDEGARAPTRELLLGAIAVAEEMRDVLRAPPPRRVTPTNDGGVLFERWDGDTAEVLEFLPEGGGEMKTFYCDHLVRRVPLHFTGIPSQAR